MSNPTLSQSSESSRKKRILPLLIDGFARLSGIPADRVDIHMPFLEMGADSLFLLRASNAIQDTFGLKIPFRMMFEDVSTIDALANHIDAGLVEDESGEVVIMQDPEPESPAPHSDAGDELSASRQRVQNFTAELTGSSQVPIAEPRQSIGDGANKKDGQMSPLEQLLAQQLQIMSKQLDVLKNSRSARYAETPVKDAQPSIKQQSSKTLPTEAIPASAQSRTEASASKINPISELPQHGTYQAVSDAGKLTGGMNERQQQHLNDLIVRVTGRTKMSKQIAQDSRSVLADNRATAGFHPLWKEMQYPLLSKRAAGARLWDVDGNEYVDLTMGFGALLFGHSPDFITEALKEQIALGMQLGAESPISGEVAGLICELTGVERVTFCNSGTEAVMSALRLARTYTGRSRIALFEACYHGTFDGVMVRPERLPDGGLRAVPAAPGVPEHMIDNVLMLRLDEAESLDLLRQHAHELAAVLIEPMPSRAPHLQLKPFLRELREITTRSGAVLIFDEVVTGFRFHQGGAQKMFDIEADLVTYGKGVGGGLPVGIIAGKASFMAAIDGGFWSYGDKSIPLVEPTFFAGTYFKHPLIMPALKAVLEYLKSEGPSLQEKLNQRTTRLVERLNQYFEQNNVPGRVANRASLFRFFFSREFKYSELFYYEMLEKGIYISETRGCFLSTAHTDEDLDFVFETVRQSIASLRRGGFLPEDSSSESTPVAASGNFGGKAAESISSTGERASQETLVLPLTEPQKHLWALDRIGEDASRAYNESVMVYLRGPLNPAALRKAIQEVANRHESLRATFDAEGKYLTIAPAVTIEIPLVEFSHLSNAERDQSVDAWAAREAQQRFDLINGPLVRAKIARLEPEYHLLILTMHHIITDGRSNGILFREIDAIYSAEMAGRPYDLPRQMQLSDFMRQQLIESHSPEVDADEAFWLKELEGTVPVLELPTDRPRPAVQTFNGARETVTFGSALHSELKRVSRKNGCSLFMTMLAGFNILLHRLSGQDEIVTGFSSAGSGSSNDQEFVGYAVRLLPLRSRFGERTRFAEYLRAIRSNVFDATDHQSYSFGRLVKRLNLKWDPSRPALVSAVFNLDRVGAKPGFAGLETEVVLSPSQSAKFDIFLNVTDTDDRLILDWEYNTDLFDAETIRGWNKHLQTLLEHAAGDTETLVTALPMLSAAQRDDLIVGWNQPEAGFPRSLCIHELFETWADRAPESIALSFEDQQLTYGRLNLRANRLANYLLGQGVRSDSIVALCLEPSLEMVVAILGVLKAGAAYAPLDPLNPQDRLSLMLEDAQARFILTQQRLAGELPPCKAQVICLDSEWGAIGQCHSSNPRADVSPDNLSYIVYTSGSTGRAKGVEVTHYNVVRILESTDADYRFSDNDVWTLFHSYSFDFSVWELWGALLKGGKLAIVPYWIRRSPEAFNEFLVTEQISVLNQTPSAFRQLAGTETATNPAGQLALRYVIFGGEALDLQSLKPWFDRHGDQTPRLVNMYGISETTIHVTLRPLAIDDLSRGGKSFIGRAISDMEVYLLDSRMEPAPIGTSGEIHVGGAGLARGYLNRPDLTAERFIPDPFSRRAGDRLYKSGDLARYIAGGEIEYLGRRDLQIKIRGFRIEPGEIEAALLDHPAVHEAIVLAREEEGNEKRLVAYVVTEQSQTHLTSELYRFLQDRLPQYMIPATFIALESMPLTRNGKIDRGALPGPASARPDLDEDFAAPLTRIERQLARIWSQVLGVEQVGLHDSFFELGGDSILAIQLVSRANEAGLRVTPKQIFQYQTIGGLAEVVGTSPVAVTEQGPVTGPVPLTPIQKWFLSSEPLDPDHFNQAVLLELRDGQTSSDLRLIISHLLEHHDALRLRLLKTDSGWEQELAPPQADVLFDEFDFSSLPDDEQSRAIESTSTGLQEKLDLSEGMLMRAAYFDLGPQKAGRLLLIVHHFAVDVVSWRILLDDLHAAWNRLRQGEAIQFPAKTTSFKQWAERLSQHAQSSSLQEAFEYWIAQSGRRANPLPVDNPEGDNSVGSTQRVVVSLTLEETQALLQEVPKAYHSQISDVLLTALAQAFSLWTGERLFAVGMEGHGREALFEDIDLSRTVGWFTSLYPVWLDISETKGPGEALKSVKEQIRGLPQGGISYGLLRHLCRDHAISSAMSAIPEPEVVFNYLGQFSRAAQPDTGPKTEQKQAFITAREDTGPTRSRRTDRGHLLEISGGVIGGRLSVQWGYSRHRHERATIERVASEFIESLREIIRHCQSPEAGGYTPSDFPDMNFSQDDLDLLMTELAESAGDNE
ncbi:MAG: amino acid adenylation domain-containing protein [Blastocatellia bacterium]